ncbi:hypothetical protein HMPREF3160_09445 [Arthrobacter sp. HMSC06H05]|uniref:glycosyltransferase n=1 Tax=Arthrobacter sp. HMSC06H05 TaxID=1581128 RepID=UPI0008A15F3C|nr:glycosyltransferase [Arthrobacter sp. HMSC06H05]OFT40711.1 hypothetical protein HMPREF3160_09445 [Arthrobacter sp. HMSC06H05]
MHVAVISMHTSPRATAGGGDAGGLNVFVDQTSRALAAAGVSVDVFTRDEPGSIKVTPGYRVHTLPAGPADAPKEELPQYTDEFAQQLSQHPAFMAADVVHAHYWLSADAALKAAHGKPVIATFHTTSARKRHHGHTRTAVETFREQTEQRIAAEAYGLTANTVTDRAELSDDLRVQLEKITIARPGIDRSVFHPEGPTASWPVEPGAHRSGLKMLFAGRFQDYKGPDVALDTLAALKDARCEASLVMIGDQSGPGSMDLAARARARGVEDRVAFKPPMPQKRLALMYRAADVVVVPSRHETFGLVAAEALASGTPVVGHAAGGLLDLIDDGVDGLLIHSRDPHEWARALSPWAKGGVPHDVALAAADHGRHFSWESTASTLLDLYRQAATHPRGERTL